jgi:hypothetical protein
VNVGDTLLSNNFQSRCLEAVITEIDLTHGRNGRITYRITKARPGQRSGDTKSSTHWLQISSIRNFYTIKETPMNPTINVGDVFVRNSSSASFDRIEILGTSGINRFRAISTRPDGTTVPTNPYRSTLLNTSRYRLEERPVRDFNEKAVDYKRPIDSFSGRPTVDLPTAYTFAVREDQAYSFLTTETATLIHVVEGEARQAKTVEAKRALLLNAVGGVMLLAVPGVYSMDTFFIDNRAKALGVLGLVQHTPTPQPVPFAAADGSQWVAA